MNRGVGGWGDGRWVHGWVGATNNTRTQIYIRSRSSTLSLSKLARGLEAGRKLCVIGSDAVRAHTRSDLGPSLAKFMREHK